jgi:hypothetical protein
MRKLRQIATLAALIALSVPVIGGAQSGSSESADPKTYTWLGEFVSVDTAAKTMTVKPRIAYSEGVAELRKFKAGDSVWIVWSGVRDSSDAVRQVGRAEGNRTIDEDLVMPAELVSTEAPNQYMTIRVKVPDSSVGELKAVKPGQWVTVTSRHGPATEVEAVVAVRAYGSTTT